MVPSDTREAIFGEPETREFLAKNLLISKFVPKENYINVFTMIMQGKEELVEHITLKLGEFQRIQFVRKKPLWLTYARTGVTS